MRRNIKVLLAGTAIIVVTNLVALGGVAYNRSGEAESLIELTERELSMPFRHRMLDENTGLGLRIMCRLEGDPYYHYGSGHCWGEPEWLDEKKLLELGFELRGHGAQAGESLIRKEEVSRKVFLVFENDGEAYQRTLSSAVQELSEQEALLDKNLGKKEFVERVKSAREKLQNERHANSRLFAIDAGIDKLALRRAYPDSSQYVFLQALVKPRWINAKPKKKWQGNIENLLINTINVPLEHRALFKPLESERRLRNRGPRYQVRVALGQRTEPWVLGAKKLP